MLKQPFWWENFLSAFLFLDNSNNAQTKFSSTSFCDGTCTIALCSRMSATLTVIVGQSSWFSVTNILSLSNFFGFGWYLIKRSNFSSRQSCILLVANCIHFMFFLNIFIMYNHHHRLTFSNLFTRWKIPMLHPIKQTWNQPQQNGEKVNGGTWE